MLRRITENPILSVLCFSLTLGSIFPWILEGKFSYSPGIITCTCVFLTFSFSVLNVVYCFCPLGDDYADFNMKLFEVAGAVCGASMFSLLQMARGLATGFNYFKALAEGPITIHSEWILCIPMLLSLVGYVVLRYFGLKIKSRVLCCILCFTVILGIAAFVLASVQYGMETLFVHVLNANVIIVFARTVVKAIFAFGERIYQ